MVRVLFSILFVDNLLIVGKGLFILWITFVPNINLLTTFIFA